jgi:uncharacterized protein DUF4202
VWAIFRGGAERSSELEEELCAEFPAVELRRSLGDESLPCLPRLRAVDWESPFFNFYELDAFLDDLAARAPGPFALRLAGESERLPSFVREVLTRCQRLMDRRNAASRSTLFDRILAEHRALHDLAKPLVRADFNHALDVWQWVLRLAPDADLTVQIAALFHDVERLMSEADARIEHRSPDYQAFKNIHALRGATLADAALERAGLDAETRRGVSRLIAEHEQPPVAGDPQAEDLALLNDADALSFLSLNSVGYLDYFGPEQTRRKVAYTVRRLEASARRYITGMRLLPQIAAAVADELNALAEVA